MLRQFLSIDVKTGCFEGSPGILLEVLLRFLGSLWDLDEFCVVFHPFKTIVE